jgi:hypothetical protein
MFQFPGFAFVPYVFRHKYLLLISANPNPPFARMTASELQISKVGFPIRKFPDQSSFAAPRNLSQRTTSFIASQRQGIHRIPLRRLIALIIDVHPMTSLGRGVMDPPGEPGTEIDRKDQYCFKHIRERCGLATPTGW